MSQQPVRETFLFFSSLLLICTAVGPVLRGSTDNKVQWFPLQHRSLKVPGAPLCWLYNRNHHVIIRRWLSPLDHDFTHSMEPVRACGKSHGIRPLCEALKTDETRRQSGCSVTARHGRVFSEVLWGRFGTCYRRARWGGVERTVGRVRLCQLYRVISFYRTVEGVVMVVVGGRGSSPVWHESVKRVHDILGCSGRGTHGLCGIQRTSKTCHATCLSKS